MNTAKPAPMDSSKTQNQPPPQQPITKAILVDSMQRVTDLVDITSGKLERLEDQGDGANQILDHLLDAIDRLNVAVEFLVARLPDASESPQSPNRKA